MTYSDQLKSPKWQKRRLQVLESAGWKCCHCGKEDRQLQVHHGAYLRGVDLWDYPDEMFHVLCDKCHKRTSGHIETFMRWFGTLKPVEVFLLSDLLPDFHADWNCPHYSGIFPVMQIMLGRYCDDDVEETGDDAIARINGGIRRNREINGYIRGVEATEQKEKTSPKGPA